MCTQHLDYSAALEASVASSIKQNMPTIGLKRDSLISV